MERAPPPADLRRLAFGPGEIIFREGDEAGCAYVIAEGEVSFTRIGADGEAIPLTTFGKGAMFGELALVKNVPRTATASTVEGCTVMEVRREALMAKLNAAEPVLRVWIDHLSGRLVDLTNRLTRDRR